MTRVTLMWTEHEAAGTPGFYQRSFRIGEGDSVPSNVLQARLDAEIDALIAKANVMDIATLIDGRIELIHRNLTDEDITQRLLREGYSVLTLNDPGGPFTGRKLGDGGPRR